MIVSYHPMIKGDRWILCAGRQPNAHDLTAIGKADAVILPQGCPRPLWEIAAENCPRVFPDYRIRFGYPGKIRQIALFEESGVRYPETRLYKDVDSFEADASARPPYPYVFKLDWGGDGETVALVENDSDLNNSLLRARLAEKSGLSGFLVQQRIDCGGRTLRVAVIGGRFFSYWRRPRDPGGFYANLNRGGVIDSTSDPQAQQSGVRAVQEFCVRHAINLAAFDLLFERNDPHGDRPYFLEINHFFGRSGLGGSSVYYRILFSEINAWLAAAGLPRLAAEGLQI